MSRESMKPEHKLARVFRVLTFIENKINALLNETGPIGAMLIVEFFIFVIFLTFSALEFWFSWAVALFA